MKHLRAYGSKAYVSLEKMKRKGKMGVTKWEGVVVTAQRVNCDIALEEQILNTSARGECGEKHYM